MTAYRVLVSHRDLRIKSVVHLEPTEQVRYLVEAGYLKPIEEVLDVAGTERGNVGADPVVPDVPRRRRKAVKAEVTDVEGGPESGSGTPDSQE